MTTPTTPQPEARALTEIFHAIVNDAVPSAWDWFDSKGAHRLTIEEPADYDLAPVVSPLFSLSALERAVRAALAAAAPTQPSQEN